MPPEATITAWARRLNSPVAVTRTAVAACDRIGREDRTRDAIDTAVSDGERIDTVAKAENQAALGCSLERPPLERLDDAGAGAPAHMESRYRVAVAHGVIAAALRPADHGKDPVAHRAQPSALFTGGERDIGFRPALRPKILVAVEARRSHPVLQRKIVAVLDAEPALLRRIHQKQSAERPEGLAAKALLAFLVDHDDALAGIGDFRRGNEAGETGSDHDYVCIVSHSSSPIPAAIEARSVLGGQRLTRYPAAIELFRFGTLRAPSAAGRQHLI